MTRIITVMPTYNGHRDAPILNDAAIEEMRARDRDENQPEKQGGPDRTREHEDAERRGNRPPPPPPRTDAERESDERSKQVTPDDTPEQRQDANK